MKKCEYCGEQTPDLLNVEGDMVCVDCAEWAVNGHEPYYDDISPAEEAENRGQIWESQ